MTQPSSHSAPVIWLYITAAMVFAMALIGAITRLTESGLSMAEWRPLIGALPPLSEVEWQRVFELYQNTPEFEKKHFWMEIEDFKRIFFWEWLHRLFGRMIGLVYALPLVFFWLKGALPAHLKPRFLFILLLGGGQGLMGWYMVKSGLVDHPEVSHFRLAAHLGLAFIIFGFLIWTAQDVQNIRKIATPRFLKIFGWLTFGLLAVTMTWGAYVAGLDAGFVYNEFPTMGHGRIIPTELFHTSPAWYDLLHNPVSIQFLHRWLGITSTIMICVLAALAYKNDVYVPETLLLPLFVVLQVGLGIATLLSQVWIPLAVMHQAGALCLIGVSISFLRKMS
jgi:heme a synthase